MAVLHRIYFNAVFGGLGGLLGWMLFGILGEKNPSSEGSFLFLTHADINAILGGAIIGGIIGYFVVSVDALLDRSAVRFARLASYGLILGALGGALGSYVGDWVNFLLIKWFDDSLLVTVIARGLGWSLLGVAIGMSEGIAARSLGKFSYGTLGGALGGFVGGCLFMLFLSFETQFLSTTYTGQAIGLVILGACIGSLSALVQAVFQPASVKVLRGWQEGREYPLDKMQNSLGRDEHVDIALFRDMKIEKHHAFIKRVGERYILINNGAPPEWTLVNDTPTTSSQELFDGDRIQLGNVILRFQLRAARNRPRPRKPPVAATPS